MMCGGSSMAPWAALLSALVLAPGCSAVVGAECAEGFTRCGARCVDLTSDELHCGACDFACASGLVCESSECVAGLDGGVRDAGVPDGEVDGGDGGRIRADGSNDVDGSIDGAVEPDGGDSGMINVDAGDSGVIDVDGGGSDAGVMCDPGETECDGACFDLGSDPAHCGRCDVACAADRSCMAGVCVPMCEAPLVDCSGACVDLTSDPDHCGSCPNVCVSGLCIDSACADPLAGHVVLIGHDYTTSRVGMNRIAGNAVFLARGSPVEVVAFTADASAAAIAGTNRAIDQVATGLGRTWTRRSVSDPALVPMELATADALVVYAQAGATDAELMSTGSTWATALATFVSRGGVVVVFDGISATNAGTYQILDGASLLAVTGHTDIALTTLSVVEPGDPVALRVPLMYRAERSSVRFDTAESLVVVRDTTGPVVIHRTIVP